MKIWSPKNNNCFLLAQSFKEFSEKLAIVMKMNSEELNNAINSQFKFFQKQLDIYYNKEFFKKMYED